MNEDLMRMEGLLKPDEAVDKYREYGDDPKIEKVKPIESKKSGGTTEERKDPNDNPEYLYKGRNVDIKDKNPKEKGPRVEDSLLGNNIDIKV